jgi:hypothetical protein
MAAGFNGCPSGTAWDCSRLVASQTGQVDEPAVIPQYAPAATAFAAGNSIPARTKPGRRPWSSTYVAMPSVLGRRYKLVAGLQVAAFADLGLME